ncbi:hypothetical protein [Micromonospora matsumotoense]|uniref:hypothetical protein n=1 Tax=Micromonospora matsumotoense TaxID=121616 RepID=UPI0033EFB8A3
MSDLLTGGAVTAAGLAVPGADAVGPTAPAAVPAALYARGLPVAPSDRGRPMLRWPPADRPAAPARLDAIGQWRA